jgi:hypothetical protein
MDNLFDSSPVPNRAQAKRFLLRGRESYTENCRVFVAYWAAPFTDGGAGIVPRGTRIRLQAFPFNPEPIGVYALRRPPIRY